MTRREGQLKFVEIRGDWCALASACAWGCGARLAQPQIRSACNAPIGVSAARAMPFSGRRGSGRTASDLAQDGRKLGLVNPPDGKF